MINTRVARLADVIAVSLASGGLRAQAFTESAAVKWGDRCPLASTKTAATSSDVLP